VFDREVCDQLRIVGLRGYEALEMLVGLLHVIPECEQRMNASNVIRAYLTNASLLFGSLSFLKFPSALQCICLDRVSLANDVQC